jgi:hypothetical protein
MSSTIYKRLINLYFSNCKVFKNKDQNRMKNFHILNSNILSLCELNILRSNTPLDKNFEDLTNYAINQDYDVKFWNNDYSKKIQTLSTQYLNSCAIAESNLTMKKKVVKICNKFPPPPPNKILPNLKSSNKSSTSIRNKIKYLETYRDSLKLAKDLPDFVIKRIKTSGISLANNSTLNDKKKNDIKSFPMTKLKADHISSKINFNDSYEMTDTKHSSISSNYENIDKDSFHSFISSISFGSNYDMPDIKNNASTSFYATSISKSISYSSSLSSPSSNEFLFTHKRINNDSYSLFPFKLKDKKVIMSLLKSLQIMYSSLNFLFEELVSKLKKDQHGNIERKNADMIYLQFNSFLKINKYNEMDLLDHIKRLKNQPSLNLREFKFEFLKLFL